MYTADGIASSESLMCDEDSCEGTKASTLDVTLTQGAAYYFAVDGVRGNPNPQSPNFHSGGV